MNPNKPEIDPDLQTNPSGKAPLSEKDFIRNGWSFFSFPFWLWLFLVCAVALVLLGTNNWYSNFLQDYKKQDPFLEVTNRSFSVFLWQFPSFMRVNSKQKTGYLTGFLPDNVNFEQAQAEEFIVAPPDLIFLYHTWHRLLSQDTFPRPISPNEFEDFLAQISEWKPENWPQAPQLYADLVKTKKYLTVQNLQMLPETVLPMIVRQSFIGWKNYFIEGAKINEVQPTFAQITAFLEKYPHYARNYWRNIDEVNHQKIGGPEYLKGLVSGPLIPEANVPNDQLSPFLKVAFFNAAAEN